MWETIKGICCIFVLVSLVVGVIVAGWTISIFFRIIALFVAVIMFGGFLMYCCSEWLSSKKKKPSK